MRFEDVGQERAGDDQIDQALRRSPTWEPPVGFAQRVAARASDEMAYERLTFRWSWQDVAQVAAAGVVIGAAGYVGAYLPDLLAPAITIATTPSQAMMWTWVAVAYGAALVFRRNSLFT